MVVFAYKAEEIERKCKSSLNPSCLKSTTCSFSINTLFPSFLRGPDHHEHGCCPADDSTLQLLDSSHQPLGSQELGGDGDFYVEDEAEDDVNYSTSGLLPLSI